MNWAACTMQFRLVLVLCFFLALMCTVKLHARLYLRDGHFYMLQGLAAMATFVMLGLLQVLLGLLQGIERGLHVGLIFSPGCPRQ